VSMLLTALVATAAQASGSPFCTDAPPTMAASLASREEDRLAHWYMGTLGFKSVHTVYSLDGDTIHVLTCGPLVLTVGPAGEEDASSNRSGNGINGIGWTVRDFAEAQRHLEDAKVTIDYGPATNPFGQRMMMFADVDGNKIDITDPATPFDPSAAR
jgi:catechol 2,3-dioxygenase-like lactoylglutathione lyase family enzyme